MKRDPVPERAADGADVLPGPRNDAVPADTTGKAVPGTNPAPSPVSAPKTSFLRSHLWSLLAALVVLVAAGSLGVRWWRGTLVSTEPVLRRNLVQTVVASGHVEAPHRVDIGAQITGTVRQVPVAEGQAVKAGDLLVELETAELEATGRQADMVVVQAQAKLRQLQEVQGPVAAQTLRQAESSLRTSRASLARSQDLFGQGFIGQAALDEVRKTAELADAQVRVAQRQLDTTALNGSDRALAVANLAGAQASVQAARARSGYATVRAPVAGTLIARQVEVGDVVQPGKVLMTLSPQGRTQLVVAIDEKNLALMALGQQALASADAYPAQRFSATLAFINPGVNASTGAVEVKFDVGAPPATLRQDMTVSVDIAVARREQVLIVPLSAVHDVSAGAWVLRLEGRHAVRRPVRLGLNSGGLAEVLKGLSAGDEVLVGAEGTAPGARVRALPPAAAAPVAPKSP